jgi:hypothetical protein
MDVMGMTDGMMTARGPSNNIDARCALSDIPDFTGALHRRAGPQGALLDVPDFTGAEIGAAAPKNKIVSLPETDKIT